MAKRKKKLLRITRPKLRVTGKGVKLQAPRARVGGKVGLNISKRGVNASAHTGVGSFNTTHGVNLRVPKMKSSKAARRKSGGCLPGCGVLAVAAVLTVLVVQRTRR